ncbi:hypothetical protein [Methylobacterium durans]|uniref:hypothetical protein n=1 Tax=Methylobacterium durans TaxID=2202825 RepID=UPI0013A53085|nr:hypothetical protein [Methylobacterium durans]
MTNRAWDENHPHFYLTDEEFFDGDPRADLGYWSRAACWTIEEAIALSYGYEPRVVNWEFLKNSGHPFAELYAQRRSLAMRARHMDQLKEFNEPEAFINWAKRQGMSFDSDLEKSVKNGKKSANTAQTQEDDHLNPKTRHSLLKLVLGVAVEKYRYDPERTRSSVAREIRDSLDRVGISLDEDTIRRRLAEAAEEFGHLITASDKAS